MKYTELFFWLSFAIIFYTFLGYGMLLVILVSIKKMFTKKTEVANTFFQPPLTLIIPCYNEAEIIPDKISNAQQLNYPAELLTIILITDGSTDHSGDIMKQYPDIVWLHENKRDGKTAAENRAMKFVKTPFVIFTDANTILNREALKNIVKHFADERVGCVSGEKRILSAAADSASSSGEEMYWKYESFLKKMDAALNSAVGAAGELVAFRTSLYTELPDDTLLDDFMQSMLIAAKGNIIAYEPQAYAAETASSNVREELKRKIRIGAGSWQAMVRLTGILKLTKTPLLYFQYFSHRILRWAVTPFLLPVLLVLNILLAVYGLYFYQVLLLLQLLFYAGAFAGYLLENKKIQFKLIFIPYYFCVMNYAVIAGLLRFLSGNQNAAWEKAQRKSLHN